MKNKLTILIISLATLLMHRQGFAQEVFFRDPNQVLRTITPDYYYPLKGDNSALAEYMQPGGTGRNLYIAPATQTNGWQDRWKRNAWATNVQSSVSGNEGVYLPFTSLIGSNKVINMCVWLNYTNSVYDGMRDGGVLDVTQSIGGDPSVEIVIKNKRLTVSKRVAGEMRTLGVMDFPIDMDGKAPGAETNRFIFIAITSTWNHDGNRLRLYVGRPGGHLYCKYFYFSPFKEFDPSHRIVIGRSNRSREKAYALSDLMFFSSGHWATTMMEPDDVLNLFYLQSPLYDGVSYQIVTNGGVWGLETRRNNNAPLGENYITDRPLTPGSSISPFGFDRFTFETNIPNTGLLIQSVANGGAVRHTHDNRFAYTSFGGWYHAVRYDRLADPKNNYMHTARQFAFYSVEWPGYFMVTYSGDYKVGYTNTWGPDPHTLRIGAANRIRRGPERVLDGNEVKLKTYRYQSDDLPRAIVHNGENESWDYIRIAAPMPYNSFIQEVSYNRQPYVFNRFKAKPSTWKFLRRSRGPGDDVDNNYMTTNGYNDCHFEYQYVRDDPNGKPLYLLRTYDHDVGFKLGVKEDENTYISQKFNNSLFSDGSVPKAFLWSVCKVDGGWPLTLDEKAKLAAEILKSQQNTSKVNYNGLSETDWPDGPPKP